MLATMSALDPVAFVRATRPFGDLPPRLFERAARSLDIGFFPVGTRLVERDGTPLRHLYIIRKGVVRLEREGQTLQLLEEGEVFGYTSLIAKKATLDAIVEEDLLAYRIPAEEFERLLADAPFASHFAVGLAERLKHSLELCFTPRGDLWTKYEGTQTCLSMLLKSPARSSHCV